MNKKMEVEEDFLAMSEKKIDMAGILAKYLSYWKWFLLSVFIFLALAVTYIYLTLPKYEVSTSILFKDDQKGGTPELNMFRDLGVVSRRNNVDNEVEIMKKSLITESVVRKLDLYATYIEMKPFLGLEKIFPNFPKRETAVLYGDELPVKLLLPEDAFNAMRDNVVFDMVVYPNNSYMFSGKYKGEPFQITASPRDTIVQFPFGEFRIERGKTSPKEEMWMKVIMQRPLDVANGFVNSMEIALASKVSSVADISLVTYNMKLGKDFLKVLVDAYNEREIKDQLELAEKTSKIIDEHLANLSNELNNVEDQAQEFRQSQGLTNIASQADLYNSQLANVSQKKLDAESQYSIVSSLLGFVQQKSGHNQLIPANSGIHSPVLNSQISMYNDLVLERNRLARIASSNNQSMIDLNNRLESTFNSVVSSLQNEKNNLEIQLREINSEYSRNNAMIRAIPQQERAFSDIKRQQNIKEQLFLYLLQKKEERYMNMTTVEPNSKLIDNISVTGVVWPNKMKIVLFFAFIGLLLPILWIGIRDLLRYQLEGKEELEKISTIPLLGEIPKVAHTHPVMVKEDNNDSFNEMFRLLRANLMFVIDGKDNKVINMLSSISGEGKSFLSINLAVSLALLDKKVLLIDLDIRKPKLAKELGLDNKQGITLYLSGYLDRKELVKPSGLHPNLSIITAGSIPPNPNELLAKPALESLVNELRDEFDFIIVDTAPLGMVSDGFLLNRIADVNLYVTRAGFTPKKYIEDAGLYFHQNRLKRMYLILNYINLNGADYRYGLYKKYGYGYA